MNLNKIKMERFKSFNSTNFRENLPTNTPMVVLFHHGSPHTIRLTVSREGSSG